VFVELIERLAAGATVVTSNRRLSAAVRRTFDRRAHQRGQRAWAASDVLPWSAWLEHIFRDACLRGQVNSVLMSHWQARALWHRVIAEAPEAQGLLQVDTTASAALEAWQLAHAWRLLPALQTMQLTDEAQAFRHWARAYEAVCAREQLTDQARLPDAVCDLLLAGQAVVPRSLVAFGFDTLSPQHEAVLEALRSRDVQVEVLGQSGNESPAVVVSHPAALEEIRAAAQWARSCVATDLQARVGVVVPELSRVRTTIARIFDEVLQPDTSLHPGHTQSRPWNISLGMPLSDWPLAHGALLLLELACGSLSIHRAGLLLRSPFVGGAESERNARALLDARLRRLGDPHITLDALIYHAGTEGHPYSCGVLAERLTALRARQRELPAAAQRVSFWGPALQSLLSAAGWPGERELNSEEYQTSNKWKELTVALAQLDLVCAPVKLVAAVGVLERLAAEELFQPETQDSPIQILGLLESAQLEFDQLLVLGLTDERWPRPARPNPLLPLELQRMRGLPGATAEWELAFARRTQAGWRRAAPCTVFSYHCTDGDRTLGPSPLLSGLSEATPTQLAVEQLPDWRATAHGAAVLERIADWQGHPLPEGAMFRGGARLLQHQAACPFRAYAIHRLGATSLDHPQEGLNARDRGILLHTALAALWSELCTQQRLMATKREELTAAIVRCVDGALARLRPRRASSFKSRFLELERERLVALLEEWLEIERDRGDFEVMGCEEEAVVNVAGLGLKLRLDRVDRLSQGGEMLIDYKTGSSSIAMWMGERPDEPQLPLYHLARPMSPEGVAFAQVRRGECGLLGLSAHSGAVDGVLELKRSRYAEQFPDWSALLARWRATLERLAAEFRAGAAPVDPKRRSVTCRSCDLSTLCRVSELVDRGSPTPGEENADE
jgi:ATP-dependent helicase/nuclease subunit B